MTQDVAALQTYRDLRLVRVHRNDNTIRVDQPGDLGWGGNSGFHALNLAVQFGARRIILVGYDLHLGGGIHWHGRHAGKLNNPTSHLTAKWRPIFDAQALRLAELGVEVLNASPSSALTAFPKVSLQEALAC